MNGLFVSLAPLDLHPRSLGFPHLSFHCVFFYAATESLCVAPPCPPLSRTPVKSFPSPPTRFECAFVSPSIFSPRVSVAQPPVLGSPLHIIAPCRPVDFVYFWRTVGSSEALSLLIASHAPPPQTYKAQRGTVLQHPFVTPYAFLAWTPACLGQSLLLSHFPCLCFLLSLHLSLNVELAPALFE